MGGPRCRRGMLGVLAWVTLLGVALFWGRWLVEAVTPPNVLVIGLSGDVDNLDPAVTMTLERIEAVGPWTVQFTLSQPSAPFLFTLAKASRWRASPCPSSGWG